MSDADRGEMQRRFRLFVGSMATELHSVAEDATCLLAMSKVAAKLGLDSDTVTWVASNHLRDHLRSHTKRVPSLKVCREHTKDVFRINSCSKKTVLSLSNRIHGAEHAEFVVQVLALAWAVGFDTEELCAMKLELAKLAVTASS